mmetsp:Transcript_448/g.412  ORF Transcript_448/g.412 Transcript_448/m.412 type:complete len:100 (+) Transcript_448:454-753(+)
MNQYAGKRISFSEIEIKQDLSLFRELSKSTFHTEDKSFDEDDYGDAVDPSDAKSISTEDYKSNKAGNKRGGGAGGSSRTRGRGGRGRGKTYFATYRTGY